MTKPLWTKDFLLNAIGNFLIYLVYYLLMVIIATHAMDTLQARPSEAGLVAGIFVVAGLVSRIFSGNLIDRIGRKRMLYGGLAIYSLATLFYFSATSLLFLLAVRIVHGIGWGIFTTTAATIVASALPRERRGEGISFFAMSVTVASAIGPFLGVYMYQYISFYAILVFSALLVATVWIAAYFLDIEDVAADGRESMTASSNFEVSRFFEVTAIPISFIGALVFFSYSSIIGFLSVYTKSIQLVDAGGWFFVVYSIAILISRPLTGRWFDEKGQNYVMYPAFFLFAVGLLVLSLADEGYILLVAAVLLGWGFGTFSSCGQAIAIQQVSFGRIGAATSTFLAIAEMGIGLGPFLLGVMIPIIGFRMLYMSMAVVVFLSMFLYYCLYGEKIRVRKRQEEQVK